jgi:hypothetical protein
MSKVRVEILHACGNFAVGNVELIEEKRAQRLVITGYARIVETATITAPEAAEQVRPAGRTPRTERRG